MACAESGLPEQTGHSQDDPSEEAVALLAETYESPERQILKNIATPLCGVTVKNIPVKTRPSAAQTGMKSSKISKMTKKR